MENLQCPNSILQEMENKLYEYFTVGAVLMNLSQAFQEIPHN